MTKNNFQDDGREEEMRILFGLYKDESEGRSGIDAYLELDDQLFPFELKTTSDRSKSVTTVRDFGPDHIKKWVGKHWLFGFYSPQGVVFKYGSPKRMEPWIKEKAAYIAPDFKISELTAAHLTLNDLHQILPPKGTYTLEDARNIQKRQYSIEKYRELMDISNGYSPNRMLSILQDRASYLVERGSTLNNPHIPGSYFNDWEEITTDHRETLKKLVRVAI